MTADGGRNIRKISDIKRIKDVDVFNDFVMISFTEIHYDGYENEMYQAFVRSDDGGETWRQYRISNTPGNPKELAIDQFNPDLLYMAGQIYERKSIWGCIHISRDGGKSWKRTLTAKRNNFSWCIESDPTRPETIYAGMDFNVLRSTDSGETWENVLQVGCKNLEVTDSGLLFGINSYSIYCSRDGGETWEKVIETDGNRKYFYDIRYDRINGLLYYGTNEGLYKMEFR